MVFGTMVKEVNQMEMLKPSEQIAKLSPERLQLFLDVARENAGYSVEEFDKVLMQ